MLLEEILIVSEDNELMGLMIDMDGRRV